MAFKSIEKKIGIIIGVIIPVLILTTVLFWMDPELIPSRPLATSIGDSIQPEVKRIPKVPFDVWTDMQLECEKYGSPEKGFESVDAQLAYNTCINKIHLDI